MMQVPGYDTNGSWPMAYEEFCRVNYRKRGDLAGATGHGSEADGSLEIASTRLRPYIKRLKTADLQPGALPQHEQGCDAASGGKPVHADSV